MNEDIEEQYENIEEKNDPIMNRKIVPARSPAKY